MVQNYYTFCSTKKYSIVRVMHFLAKCIDIFVRNWLNRPEKSQVLPVASVIHRRSVVMPLLSVARKQKLKAFLGYNRKFVTFDHFTHVWSYFYDFS